MKKILATNPGNWLALIARLALAVTIFPHGAQKLLGWFGGGGFNASMGFLTGPVGLPWIIGLLVILIESVGSALLFVGLITRIAAVGVIVNFLGVVLSSHFYNEYFMNWARVGGKAEGLEYFIMLFGLALICLIAGGGKASLDATLSKGRSRQFSRL
jgi:putative oxidoreductase